MNFGDRDSVQVLLTCYTFPGIFWLGFTGDVLFFLKKIIKKNAKYIYLKCEPTYNHFPQVKMYTFEHEVLQFEQTFLSVSYVLVFTPSTT